LVLRFYFIGKLVHSKVIIFLQNKKSCQDKGIKTVYDDRSCRDISRMSHAHPTFVEAIKEAGLAVTDDRALHI
jgi:hypothetical protein